jgi:3-deoxy-D-manno-octulosonate 8-phosphate phosphatase (KDO 8-P phosphatase)
LETAIGTETETVTKRSSMTPPTDLEGRLAAVQLLLLDCDGVLTDGGVTWSDEGVELKTFHIRDGLGIRGWQRAGGRTGIITGRSSRIVERRAAELGIEFVRQGVDDKLTAAGAIIKECGLSWEQTAFMGDDLPDLPVVARCGVGVAVADACPELVAAATVVTRLPGGRGAVRELVERMLRARGGWEAIVRGYATPRAGMDNGRA